MELSSKTIDNLLEDIPTDNKEIQEQLQSYQLLKDDYFDPLIEEKITYLTSKQNLEYLSKTEQEKKSESYVLDHQEAKEKIEQFQIKSMSNQKDELSIEDKRKMALYWLFDKVMALFYHETSPVRTGNVDYSFPIG